MRNRAPATLHLRKAQLILILVALVPTILTTPIGILLLAAGDSSSMALVAGILVLAFCASSVVGFILGSIFLRRGASLVEIQSDFLSAVSHDLRTPMTSMRMFVEALLDERLNDPDERRRCLTTMHREIGRLDRLVGRLIELLRIEGIRQPFELVPIAIETTLHDALAAFEVIQLESGNRVKVEIAPNLEVLGDRAALTQVFVNLLSNAWQHGGADTRIKISARALGEREIEVAIADDGPGIPKADQERIFEMFERGGGALQSASSGSGLGLAIVKAIVKIHRGRIELQSSPDHGTCFRICIPSTRRVSAEDREHGLQ